MRALRRLLAISLLAFFGLSFVSPLFALNARADKGVPACCRRDGKHSCTVSAGERASIKQDAALEFRGPSEKCPCCPVAIAIVHGNGFALPTAQAVYAGLTAHPAIVAQTESKLRISLGRVRQKRGPPVSSAL
jgi:hypothetical protein